MDNAKKSIGTPVLVAVGPKDKENFASPDLILKNKTPEQRSHKRFMKFNSKECNKNLELMKNKINDIKTEGKQITAATLTTTENPGSKYWEELSENRRLALEETLKENANLHARIMELEYEKTSLKASLEESMKVIKIFTEMFEEMENNSPKDDDENDNDDDHNDADASIASVSSL